MEDTRGKTMCGLCGKPMPTGEEMFQYHGFSGPCPIPKPNSEDEIRKGIYQAVAQLERSEVGRHLKTELYAFLNGSYCSADGLNRASCHVLTDAFNDGFRGSVLDAIRDEPRL
jgi:hypothetical protein